jgi:parallel beta-helix repeat protein
MSKQRIGVVSTVVFVLASLLATSASATSGLLVVTASTTLTEDHFGSISIDSDHVTLDCAGHTIHGSGESAGVMLDSRNDVTVKNCLAAGFVNGYVVLDDGTPLTPNANTLISNTAVANAAAGFAIEADGTTMLRNVSRGNGADGYFISHVRDLFVRNQAIDNEGNGFSLVIADRNRLIDNLASGNAADGFSLTESLFNVFELNRAEHGGAYGFALRFGSAENTLEANEAVGNVNSGFVVRTRFSFEVPLHNRLARNRATDNGQAGFFVDGAEANLFTDNMAFRNAADGFLLLDAVDNVLVRNRAIECSDGYVLDASHANELTENLGNTNGHNGFWARNGASGNVLGSNVAQANANFDAVDDLTGSGNLWTNNHFGTTDGI